MSPFVQIAQPNKSMFLVDSIQHLGYNNAMSNPCAWHSIEGAEETRRQLELLSLISDLEVRIERCTRSRDECRAKLADPYYGDLEGAAKGEFDSDLAILLMQAELKELRGAL